MSTLIYVETSIPSFYFETRERTRFQAMREWTREWWEVAKGRDTLVTSEACAGTKAFQCAGTDPSSAAAG